MRSSAKLPRRLIIVCIVLLCSSTGCSNHSQRVRNARQHFHAGNLTAAGQELAEYRDSHANDADATSLDLAMIQLLDGQPADAEATLRSVRDNLDHNEQTDAVELGVSMLTDDQRLAYSGTNYEKVLTRVFLALSNLLHEGQDAEAYSLQINAKQQELLQDAVDEQIENAESAYTPLAIGPYLRGVLRESTYSNYDDAARAYHQVACWQPQFHGAQADLSRAKNGVHSRPGHGVLYAFVLANRGPVREQVAEIPTSAAMFVADRILSSVGEYDVPPTIAAIKIPRVSIPPREVDFISVATNRQPLGRTETICDIADLALRQEEVELPHIMGRAVARRIIKKSAVYATKDAVEADNALSDLGLSALGVLWEASEAADTRCWGLLPREIQVVRLELPAGEHSLELIPVLVGGTAVQGPTTTVHIEDGGNTYLLACFPGPSSVGQIIQR